MSSKVLMLMSFKSHRTHNISSKNMLIYFEKKEIDLTTLNKCSRCNLFSAFSTFHSFEKVNWNENIQEKIKIRLKNVRKLVLKSFHIFGNMTMRIRLLKFNLYFFFWEENLNFVHTVSIGIYIYIYIYSFFFLIF